MTRQRWQGSALCTISTYLVSLVVSLLCRGFVTTELVSLYYSIIRIGDTLPVAKMKRRGERNLGNGWQRSVRGILLIYGRIFGFYPHGIYVILSEGEHNNSNEESTLKLSVLGGQVNKRFHVKDTLTHIFVDIPAVNWKSTQTSS